MHPIDPELFSYKKGDWHNTWVISKRSAVLLSKIGLLLISIEDIKNVIFTSYK